MLKCVVCGREEDEGSLYWVDVEDMGEEYIGVHLKCLFEVQRRRLAG